MVRHDVFTVGDHNKYLNKSTISVELEIIFVYLIFNSF